MPWMNKGGKFIFGKSLIRPDGVIRIPTQAIDEYDIMADNRKAYLFTGSKSTGGFCVTRRGLLAESKLRHLLAAMPRLRDYTAAAGEFLPYKGRSYCWVNLSESGEITLTEKMRNVLEIEPGMYLLAIRSSDIAFTMGAKGPLLKRAANYQGTIPAY